MAVRREGRGELKERLTGETAGWMRERVGRGESKKRRRQVTATAGKSGQAGYIVWQRAERRRVERVGQ